MKRFLVFILIALMVFLSACSTNGNTHQPSNIDNSTQNPSESAKAEEPQKPVITVQETVLLDKDGIKITLKSLSDDIFGPSLKVLVENNSDISVTVQIRDSSINGVMVDAIFSCDVQNGKKANSEIVFMSSDLETANITTIKDIELKFHVFTTDGWDTVFDSETINIVTSADTSFVQTFDDSGIPVLDKDGIRIVIKKLDSTDSIWGAELYLFVENNSENDVTIQLRDTSINGFMIDPIFSCDVLSGKKAFDSITFFESNLQENDITEIEIIEFSVHIFDASGWNTIFDSEPITVDFK